MDTIGEINTPGVYSLESWDSPGVVVPEKFLGPILSLCSGRIDKNAPTVSIRDVAGTDKFPLVSETLGWWHEHRARVLIVERNLSGRGRHRIIGWYHIDALAIDNDNCVWMATFRIIGRFDYGNRLNLNATMMKAWTEAYHRLDEQSRSAGISVTSDSDSVTLTAVGTNSVPSGIVHFKTVYRGPDTSGLYESIGRIEMALRMLEGEICLYVGHISLGNSNMTDCPKRHTFGQHCDLLSKAHTNCSCPADSELHRAISLVKGKSLAWRNGFAHGLPAFDAPIVLDSGLGDFDEKTNTFTKITNVPQPLYLIRVNDEALELTPETLIQIENDIIDAWSIITFFNMEKLRLLYRLVNVLGIAIGVKSA